MEPLKQLERQVEAAAKAIEKLKRENRSLKTKVKKLEAERGKSSGASAWAKERQVVQQRLTNLAEHLEELV
jgi:cell division protein FtsB